MVDEVHAAINRVTTPRDMERAGSLGGRKGKGRRFQPLIVLFLEAMETLKLTPF